MKKFSKLNESLNQEILGWSPNDILEYLKKIPNCKPDYLYTHFIFRDDDGHEICSLEDIKNGEIGSKHTNFHLDPEQEYHASYSFRLEFILLDQGTRNYLLFDNGEEKETSESIPISKITKIFTDIENSITPLRVDFYIHLYYDKKLELHNLFIDLEYINFAFLRVNKNRNIFLIVE